MRKKPIEKNLEAIYTKIAKIEAERKKLDGLIDRRKQLLRKLGIPIKPTPKAPRVKPTERDIIEVSIMRHRTEDDYSLYHSDTYTYKSFPITIGSRSDRDLPWDEDEDQNGKKIFAPRHGYIEVVNDKLNYICLFDPAKNQMDLDIDDHIIFGDKESPLFVLTIREIVRLLQSKQPSCAADTKTRAALSLYKSNAQNRGSS